MCILLWMLIALTLSVYWEVVEVYLSCMSVSCFYTICWKDFPFSFALLWHPCQSQMNVASGQGSVTGTRFYQSCKALGTWTDLETMVPMLDKRQHSKVSPVWGDEGGEPRQLPLTTWRVSKLQHKEGPDRAWWSSLIEESERRGKVKAAL